MPKHIYIYDCSASYNHNMGYFIGIRDALKEIRGRRETQNHDMKGKQKILRKI